MAPALFQRFCEIAHARAGIAIRPGKEHLVTARVNRRIRALQLGSDREYLDFLESDGSGEELVLFLDAISTNYTSFMREPDHFDVLAGAVTKLRKRGQDRIRVWCAASSTGEEPYTIAMVLAETLGLGFDWKLLATDISTNVLGTACRGEYSEDRISPLSEKRRERFFERINPEDESPGQYRAIQELRDRIVFKRLNLSTPPFPMQGPLDFVFCRNVMIYFDNAVKKRLLAEVERLMAPGAIFVSGHSEPLSGLTRSLQIIRPSVYVKTEVKV